MILRTSRKAKSDTRPVASAARAFRCERETSAYVYLLILLAVAVILYDRVEFREVEIR